MPLADMAPDGRAVKHATGVYARVLSTPRGEYAMYFDGDGPSEITLDLPAGNYSGEWLPIASGTAAPLAGFRHAGGEKKIPSPEFHGGIALRLTRASK
jgi:hypothetical protein